MSTTRHHAEWLSLIEVSGPFLSLPVLLRVFPQGLEAVEPERWQTLRLAYEEWEANQSGPRPDPALHREWVRFVLGDILGLLEAVLAEGDALPDNLTVPVQQEGETLQPNLVILDLPGSEAPGLPRLLVSIYPAAQELNKAVSKSRWKASPATRMLELLHATGVPLGLVTNGEHWLLVHAPRGETSSYVSWYAGLWLEEPLTLRAFVSLLGVRRWFGVAANETLPALFAESARHQQEVTDQLGWQVRQAVEILIRSLDQVDKDRGRTLLQGVDEQELYRAALTVMMRLVFLLFAEERELLLLGNPVYDQHYAVSTLRAQLREQADQVGEEVLERRHDAWSRLLATFRLVYAGVDYEDLRLPAYGGRLFDPDRYPFLEGRGPGTSWQGAPAEPLPIHNRTVLHLLGALQVLELRTPGGGPAEARRLSFRALDVEQIGHVYESLLDHHAVRASGPLLGLVGAKGKDPEVPLAKLEAARAKGEAALVALLVEETGRSASALQRALTELELQDEARLRVACDNDPALFARVRPFATLLRVDSNGYPLVITAGSVYVTHGLDRRSTGTHYTPPTLTESLVKHALDPLVYASMAEGKEPTPDTLRSPRELLALKICDPACGSGAFLVQACRYLADKLVESWERAEWRALVDAGWHQQGLEKPTLQGVAESLALYRKLAGTQNEATVADLSEMPVLRDQETSVKALPLPRITLYGEPARDEPNEQWVPLNTEERLIYARRLIADRCLCGVDINPMAAEMAKLSLWLVTLQKNKPFTFLDHAIRVGDSLLGITALQDLDWFYMDATGQRRLGGHTDLLKQAQARRLELEAIPDNALDQVESKARLLEEAEILLEQLRLLADVVTGARLAATGRRGKTLDEYLQDAAMWDIGTLEQRARVDLEGRRPFHWPLEFPEVFTEERSGFDALVGNPPFMGGQKITGPLGKDYRDYLVQYLADGKRGSVDLCAYFFLRAGQVLRKGGMLGMLATNTIAQGDTREVGLEQLVEWDFSIPRAVSSRKWPGEANLEVAHVWLRRGKWKNVFVLDDKLVAGITPFLTVPGAAMGNLHRLAANADKSFIGSYVLGMGFVLTPEEAQALIDKDLRNRDALFPYLNGEDLNSRPDQSPSRWVINFHDWPLSREADGNWVAADDKQRREWLKRGIVPADYPGPVAADYPDLLAIVEEKVKPERMKNKRAIRRERWWQFAERAPALYSTIAGMGRVLVAVQTSKYLSLNFQAVITVFSHMTVVFALDDYISFAVLNTSWHTAWIVEYCSSLETRLRYIPTDGFETFPFPASTAILETIGERYYTHRQSIMQTRQEGLTQTYNRFHNSNETAEDIAQLRALHLEMDYAVAAAYGWTDLDLEHGFHETKQGLRYTISGPARREILDHLLRLNFERYEEEVRQGLHDKKGKKPKAAQKPRKAAATTVQNSLDL